MLTNLMENKAQASARQNPWFSGRTPFSLRHELSFEHHGCFVSPRVYFFLFRRCSPRHLQAGTTVNLPNDLNGLQLSFFALLRRVAGCSGDCTIPADLLAAEHRAIPVVGSTDTGSTPRYGPTPSLDHPSVASSGGCATIHESFAALSHSDHGLGPSPRASLSTGPGVQCLHLFLPRTDGPLCPVNVLSVYLHVRGDSPGPSFRFSDGVPLSRPHVTDWLCSILAAADAQAAGIPDSLDRTIVRRSSDAYLVYIRTSQETLRSAASRLSPGLRYATRIVTHCFRSIHVRRSSVAPFLGCRGISTLTGPFSAWRPPRLRLGCPGNRPSTYNQAGPRLTYWANQLVPRSPSHPRPIFDPRSDLDIEKRLFVP